jgi:hypothetical protein
MLSSTRSKLPASILLLLALPAGAAPLARPSTEPAAASSARRLAVVPASIILDRPDARQPLLVSGVSTAGDTPDLTRAAHYLSTNPRVAQVSGGGVVRPVSDGTALIEVRAAGTTARVPVRVRGSGAARPLSFPNDILPVLSKAGCNGAACHAKQGGKNGFQLSVLAYDPEADYHAIVRQADGRRVNRQEPARSLLLLKATLTMPHGGGRRFAVGAPEYNRVARWISEGARYGEASDPVVTRIEVEPKERVLRPGAVQQLLTTAVYSDGSRRDVTPLADYKSNETAIAGTDDTGLLTTTRLAGEAAVMVRYMGQVAVARVTVPLKNRVAPAAYARLPRYNFIDPLVYRKLSALNLLPSGPCDDAAFLRRASLDLTGTLPTVEETRAFLAECEAERGVTHHGDTETRSGKEGTQGGKGLQGREVASPNTRTPEHPNTAPLPNTQGPTPNARMRLVDKLLDRPEYADYWAMRWVNILLVDRDPLFPKGAFAYDRWVRDAFRANMPFNQFAHDLVTGSGETYHDGPANFFRALGTPMEQAKSVSQLFLGVRIDCAQCHHHPFERWSQDDFYSMAAFFARVRRKGAAEFEQVVYAAPDGEVKHPKTDRVMPPKPLGGPAPEVPEGEDRREYLARWMTAPENPFFARVIVNRMWGMLMGRGLVEPVDDFRVTNPASNEPLLDSLARDFTEHGYDLKRLLRAITASAAYQRSSAATPNNARDTRNYSRFYLKRVPAEVLLDAIARVTGVPEVYSGHPAGTRAIQMWDNKLPVEFLDVFGRPSRLSVCECDRPTDGSVPQVLHLMNGPGVQNRLTAETGAVTALEKSGKSEEEIIGELYLAAYSRNPTPAELRAARAAFTRPGVTRRAAIEDLLWVLLNSPEFLFGR